MKAVYKITYDVKVGRDWLGAGNPNGFAAEHVVSTGDARDACHKLTRVVYARDYGDKPPRAVRIIHVERIAEVVG